MVGSSRRLHSARRTGNLPPAGARLVRIAGLRCRASGPPGSRCRGPRRGSPEGWPASASRPAWCPPRRGRGRGSRAPAVTGTAVPGMTVLRRSTQACGSAAAGNSLAPSAGDIPTEAESSDREWWSSTVSVGFRWLALSELCQAPREFPFQPASAERCQLAPFSDFGVSPATAQAPPRRRVGTADVDAWGRCPLCSPFHEGASAEVPPFALTRGSASRKG